MQIPVARDAPASSTWDDAWFTPGRFAALLGLLICAAFPKVVLGLETFIYRDYGLFGYPLAKYYRDSFWRGELPLWNPLNDCGVPFLAQWNTLVLYPPSLFYLLFPLSWALGVFCLLHLFLGGLGMYFLAERWSGQRFAAVIAGLAFAFNGLALNSLMWPNNIAALGWMPWVVLAVERAWREGGPRIVLAALAGALQMLAGAPEIILQTWLFLGALWLHEWWRGERPRGAMLRRLSAVVLLVSGLAAAQLLPFLDLLAHSQRDAGFATNLWAMPPTGWANFLVPIFRTTPGSSGVHLQETQQWTSSYYLGVGVRALALLAAGRLREHRVGLLAGATLLSVILALGENAFVYSWVKTIFPPAGTMRFPIKFITLAVFTVPLLAALAVAGLPANPPARGTTARRRVGGIGLALLAFIPLIVVHARIFPEYALAAGEWTKLWVNGLSRMIFLALVLGR